MKVSLVMAVYNGEKYLIEQLDSIRKQTYPIDEVILLDDVSTESALIEERSIDDVRELESIVIKGVE